MKNWKPILGILLTFVLGTFTGGLVVAAVAVKRIETFVRDGAQDVAPMIVKRLGNKLDLTSEQKGRLTTIVTKGQGHLRDIRNRVKPEIQASLSGTVDEIRSILTPEQKIKFEEIVKRGEKHFGPLKP